MQYPSYSNVWLTNNLDIREREGLESRGVERLLVGASGPRHGGEMDYEPRKMVLWVENGNLYIEGTGGVVEERGEVEPGDVWVLYMEPSDFRITIEGPEAVAKGRGVRHTYEGVQERLNSLGTRKPR